MYCGITYHNAFMLGKTVIEKKTRTRHFDMAGSGFESTGAKFILNVDTYFQTKQRAGDRDTRRVYL
jgi:hypothetical protein